jgi:hypothetical protein
MPAEIKAIHVPVNDVHAVICALDITCLIDLDAQGLVLPVLDYLHEPSDCGTGQDLLRVSVLLMVVF